MKKIHNIDGKNIYKWNISEGQKEWAYPLSISGNIYFVCDFLLNEEPDNEKYLETLRDLALFNNDYHKALLTINGAIV